MTNGPLDPSALLQDSDKHRLTLRARLKPASGLDRFQPAGFPEIGHVIYDAPRSGDQRDGIQKVCIVDSAASMANHLETVCLASKHSLDLVDELEGLPYVECRVLDSQSNVSEGGQELGQLVVTTLSEGHRLASTYFLDGKKREKDGKLAKITFKEVLREEFGIRDLNKKSHPLPDEWWRVFSTIFKYDPNSLIHGVLFPAMGIKLPRVLTAHLEAFDAARVRSSGVKFDKLGKTSSGQPIFSVDEETAREIVATFVIDLALLRSFGRQGKDCGLNNSQKEFLLALALWKVGHLLKSPFRYRSNCDLELDELHIFDIFGEKEPVDPPDIKIEGLIKKLGFGDSPVTRVFWQANELFPPGENDSKENVNTGSKQANG